MAALLVQVYDLSGFLNREQVKFENSSWSTPLKDPIWEKLATKYSHISFIPGFPNKPNLKDSGYAPITLFATENNMSVNDGSFARAVKDRRQQVRDEIERLKRGEVEKNTLYIFTQNPSDFLKTLGDEQDLYGSFDGYTLLAPDFTKLPLPSPL